MFAKCRDTVEKILVENIIPFWYPSVVDYEDGGYRLSLDNEGKYVGPSDKDIISQSRTLWFFSRLSRTPYGKPEHLEAARHGYRFFREKMWDDEHGGFYWKVNSSGEDVVDPIKQTCGQAFAMYALIEYARAAKDDSAAVLVEELFSLLEKRAYDAEHGGYFEIFNRDWSAPPSDAITYAQTTPNVKLLGTHMHLMESYSDLYRFAGDRKVKDRLLELMTIESGTVMRKDICVSRERFEFDWTPIEIPEQEFVSYGHDLENIWLLMEACDSVGMQNSLLKETYRATVDYCLEYGYDSKGGGFFYLGPLRQQATKRQKIWWIQSEALVCLLKMRQLTSEEKYFDSFEKTLDWVNGNIVDWKNGDWYWHVDEDGKPREEKAGPWKTPYHNGRSMIFCLEIIDELTTDH